jgi:Family of unknown function (DUF5946)
VNQPADLGACPGCGLELPAQNGRAPAHIGASPACWALYGRLLVRAYGAATEGRVHGLTVATYVVQHPGGSDPPAIQSLGMHLIGLCLMLERGASAPAAARVATRIRERRPALRWLEPPKPNGTVTVADVVAAQTPAEHAVTVERWARSVWDAWATEHATVRDWIDDSLAWTPHDGRS